MKRNTKSLKLALASGVALSLVCGAGAAADLTRSFAVGVNGCDAAVQLCTPVPTEHMPSAEAAHFGSKDELFAFLTRVLAEVSE